LCFALFGLPFGLPFIFNPNQLIMSDQKYDSVLVGWADDPKYNDAGELLSWNVRLKDHELKDMLDQYVTKRDEEGRGGNVYVTLFMSKNGKACARVFNPNSEAAKEKRQQKQAANAEQESADLPF
tara:strand:+ start:127 stop:501 length:375 start_codon:yes stop_codon:yes gene_type:complete